MGARWGSTGANKYEVWQSMGGQLCGKVLGASRVPRDPPQDSPSPGWRELARRRGWSSQTAGNCVQGWAPTAPPRSVGSCFPGGSFFREPSSSFGEAPPCFGERGMLPSCPLARRGLLLIGGPWGLGGGQPAGLTTAPSCSIRLVLSTTPHAGTGRVGVHPQARGNNSPGAPLLIFFFFWCVFPCFSARGGAPTLPCPLAAG